MIQLLTKKSKATGNNMNRYDYICGEISSAWYGLVRSVLLEAISKKSATNEGRKLLTVEPLPDKLLT